MRNKMTMKLNTKTGKFLLKVEAYLIELFMRLIDWLIDRVD
jgi:hypothetical protein